MKKFYSILFTISSILIFLFNFWGCQEVATSKKKMPRGPFFGVKGDSVPRLLAPNLLASAANEYNGTFSPMGDLFYYTTDVPENAYITVCRMMKDSTWSMPQVAAFSGVYSDYDPLFSPDGNRLYFSSSRPEADNMNSNIWYAEIIDKRAGEPQAVILTDTEKDEFYSSVTNTGTIYFNIWETGQLLRAKKFGENYSVEPLDSIIIAPYDKGDPFISPNEDYLIFRGYGDDSLGRGDLYITFNLGDHWTVPENLGEPINSTAHEMCPSVTSDGKLFIFASSRVENPLSMTPYEPISKVVGKFQSHDNGELNIYYMSADFIKKLRSKYAD